ncbi:unnamed protein product [Protopolystoma xenopodis]|uniref:HTH La-type RNA-binding domain-containing protein n=1 Tax=Protopolystoma xenopodis TaxID=117903 RepID=A0A3S5C6R0_9PLAT|nr:unnamed protein product [Protopolystoma xenopodis]
MYEEVFPDWISGRLKEATFFCYPGMTRLLSFPASGQLAINKCESQSAVPEVSPPQASELVESEPYSDELAREAVSPDDELEPDASVEFIAPTPGVVEKIIRQCEFYFSNANILKDPFLLKKAKSDKEGWIELSIIERFSRMRQISSDHLTFLYALRQSKLLEISENGLMIRRIEPLPDWDPSVYNRSIIISKFPCVTVTVDSITDLFTICDLPPRLVRVLSPQRRIPADLKRTQYFHPMLGVEMCAIIEFDSRDQAMEGKSIAETTYPGCYRPQLL